MSESSSDGPENEEGNGSGSADDEPATADDERESTGDEPATADDEHASTGDDPASGEGSSPTADERRCPECGGRLVRDEERGELVCEDCGLVVEEAEIDRGPEWRAFGPEEDEERSRVGAPTTKLLHDEGLSTKIGWQDRDAYGTALSASQRERMRRLRTWNERFRTKTPKERGLKQALAEVDRMASALGLARDLRETAGAVFRRAQQADLLPGRSIEGVASAALYVATRQAGVPVSLDDVARVSRVDREEVADTYRYLVRELDLGVAPPDPASYVPRFASELGLSGAVERRARHLLAAAAEADVVSGRSPVGLAAAAVYAAALDTDERVTQAAVSEVADVSTLTIRKRYQELLAAADGVEPSTESDVSSGSPVVDDDSPPPDGDGSESASDGDTRP